METPPTAKPVPYNSSKSNIVAPHPSPKREDMHILVNYYLAGH